MANEQNLIPFNKMTEKQQRELASRGGKASQKARRERKTFKEILETLLEKEIEDKTTGEMVTRKEAMTVMLLQNAIKGNMNAWREIRDTIGERPVEEHHITGTIPTDMSVESMLDLKDIIDGKKAPKAKDNG